MVAHSTWKTAGRMVDLATRTADAELHSPSAGRLELGWLPAAKDWLADIKAADQLVDPAAAWSALVALAQTRMDFIRTGRLDRSLRKQFGDAPPPGLATKPVRLAVLGSSTLTHVLPGIRVAALRRGIWVTTYEADYGQYLQELSNKASPLHAFAPDTVLFAFDAPHLLRGCDPAFDAAQADAALGEIVAHVRQCWSLARNAFRCAVLQQSALPVFPGLMGNNEHRLPGSRRRLTARLNDMLLRAADDDGVDLLALHDWASEDGIDRWHDPVLWHRGKQEISPIAMPFYGDLVGRLLAARQGRSYKALVLDLDNTLWGGVIGDDGLDGIVLGQGSADGEAFVAFQQYARDLAKRGVILAVCSKNDAENALAPFEQHPDMALKRSDIAAFVANWDDKATNIRRIAVQLNIGLDALVFVDDNPFERNLVRAELPMVAVPEVPDDPALIPAILAAAGYFESLAITEEDRERTTQYQANIAREELASQSTDIESYLRGLDMRLVWRRFDKIGMQRIVQLVNKTNQFNLTTQRYTENDVLAVMEDARAFGLQLRLLDKFGDNGIIAIIIGRMQQDEDLLIDTWLMSCRVLGRQVEEATLNLVAAEAQRLGAHRLVGVFRPTAKNAMVREHYPRLGFSRQVAADDGAGQFILQLDGFVPAPTFIAMVEA
jgi:FkbH-like protein